MSDTAAAGLLLLRPGEVSSETAAAIADGLDDPARVVGPTDAFALRNPDVYVAGVRLNLVRSPAALAEQVPGLSEQDAAANEFSAGFLGQKRVLERQLRRG